MKKKYALGSSGVMDINNFSIDPEPRKPITKSLTNTQIGDLNKKKSFAGLEVTEDFGQSGYFITEEEQAKLDAAKKSAELSKRYDPSKHGILDITKERNRYTGDGVIVGDSYKMWKTDPTSFVGKSKPIEGQDYVYYSPKQYKKFQDSDIYKQKYPEEFTPQYAFGTGDTGVVVNPNQTLSEFQHLLDNAKIQGESNIWANTIPMVASLATQFAGSGMFSGGDSSTTPIAALGTNNISGQVEVEGDEVIEQPNSAPVQVQGPSHEQGGINMNVEPGTKIYSDRIKIGGKTMAERKKNRENLLLGLDKKSSTRQGDEATKNSVVRMRSNVEKEEASDLNVQELINSFQNIRNKFANGTGPNGVNVDANSNGIPDYLETSMAVPSTVFGPVEETLTPPITSVNSLQPVGTTYNQALEKESNTFFTPKPVESSGYISPETPSTPSTGYMPTAGDMTSLFGNLISTFGPMENTKANRAGDTPNINAFQNFGQDALSTNEDMLGLVRAQAANAATKLNRGAVATKRSARGTSRSINTQRAMDTLIDLETNAQELGIDDNLSQQMMQVLGNRTGLQNTRDQVVMGGEQQRDLADRQDRDAFYTQMAQDISTKGEGIQTIGKDLNAMSENQMYMKMLNQMSKYFQFDSQGNIIGINQAK